MSGESDLKKEAVNMYCASCGKAEIIDDIKLKDCDGGCDLAQYCGDKCKKDHRPEHEAICKERAAELRDELLFRQPESTTYGDCPICCLPIPFQIDADHKRQMFTCCGKMVCSGCVYANILREMEDRLKQSRCPFCRSVLPENDEEANTMKMNRAALNDPVALFQLGNDLMNEGDNDSAFKYLSRSAELGYAMAHFKLYYLYHEGNGVELDEKMAIYHLEEAAIAGHPESRLFLGFVEQQNDRHERALKHWITAANLGSNNALQIVKECYKDGHVSKDDLAAALRAHQAAIDETKSPQREIANEHYRQHLRG